jgi:hypothetical protein
MNVTFRRRFASIDGLYDVESIDVVELYRSMMMDDGRGDVVMGVGGCCDRDDAMTMHLVVSEFATTQPSSSPPPRLLRLLLSPPIPPLPAVTTPTSRGVNKKTYVSDDDDDVDVCVCGGGDDDSSSFLSDCDSITALSRMMTIMHGADADTAAAPAPSWPFYLPPTSRRRFRLDIAAACCDTSDEEDEAMLRLWWHTHRDDEEGYGGWDF